MPASLILPAQAVLFSGDRQTQPVDLRPTPAEGTKAIAINMAWGAGGDAPLGVLDVPLQQIDVAEFGAIKAVAIDNSQNGADVQLWFQDTQTTLTMPAGESGCVYVITRQRQFFVICTGGVAGDKTFMQVLNFIPPPFVIPKSVFSNVVVTGAVSITAGSTVPILGATVNGTLTGAQLRVSNVAPGAGAGTMQVILRRVGGGAAYATGTYGLIAGQYTASAILISLQGINVRFVGGLEAVISVAGTAFATGVLSGEVFYRTP